ncbi:MAG: MipA/OmpV family protein [Stenotrophomonas sp.]
MANYYGTLERGIARGAPRYRPGAVTVPHLGVSLLRPLGTRWAQVGNARYSRLPSALADSPLVQAGTDGPLSLFVGVSGGFTPCWVRPDQATPACRHG